MIRMAGLAGLALALALPVPAAAQGLTLNRVTLRFYEGSGGLVLPAEKRVYLTHFDALRTRYIGGEVTVEHAAAPSAMTLSVGCTATRPDGKAVGGIWKIPLRVAAGATRSSDANTLFGAGAAGWLAGVYKVVCSSGDRQLVESTFDITQNPSDVADAEIRVAKLQFFLTGAKTAALADRNYEDRFLQSEATRIAVEVSFVHPVLGRRVEVPVDCYYVTPNQVVYGTMNMSYVAEPTATGGTAAMGIGWDEPGKWGKGEYQAVCLIRGRPVAVDRFTVW